MEEGAAALQQPRLPAHPACNRTAPRGATGGSLWTAPHRTTATRHAAAAVEPLERPAQRAATAASRAAEAGAAAEVSGRTLAHRSALLR
jgi:hypothetical protein